MSADHGARAKAASSAIAMTLVGAVVGGALGSGLILAARSGPAPLVARTTEIPEGATTVVGHGFRLASVKVRLPEGVAYPAGPGSDVMNANCTACHSPEMVLTQPALTDAQWTAEIDKMRHAYKANIDDQDVPAILGYLNAISASVAKVVTPACPPDPGHPDLPARDCAQPGRG